MANVKIQTTIPLTIVDNGQRFSPRKGEILEVPEETAEALIEDSLASEYNLIEPTGKITITENGSDIDVAQYAKADVAVPNPNRVVTVTGTGANPWGDLDFTELGKALETGNASASMIISMGPGNRADAPLVAYDFDVPGTGTIYYMRAVVHNGATVNAADFAWTANGVANAYLVTEGVVQDLSSVAGQAVTELTVIYHPLPEDNS